MATIPSPREARQMVRQAMQERTPEAHRQMEKSGDLETFLELQALAMIERMHELNDPSVALRQESPLLEKARQIAEIRNRAVEQVLAETLSTESLEAATSTSPLEG